MRRSLILGAALVAVLAVPTAAQAAPGCSGAIPYVAMASHNEAVFIGAPTGFTPSGWTWLECIPDNAAFNRTYVRLYHYGNNFGGYGNPEKFYVGTYVYGSQGSYNMGSVDWYHDRYIPPSTSGTYATPNE